MLNNKRKCGIHEISKVKSLETKLPEIYYMILKYKSVILYVPIFVFIGLFLRVHCFRKEM